MLEGRTAELAANDTLLLAESPSQEVVASYNDCWTPKPPGSAFLLSTTCMKACQSAIMCKLLCFTQPCLNVSRR
eukprot:3280230-Karenia_brevis.AAC.1